MLFLLLVLSGRAAAETVELRGATMGTTYRIRVDLPEDARARSVELSKAVQKILADVDLQMSTYRPDSELMQFNRAPANEWIPVSAAVVEVVAKAQEISQKSDGALDITVGPLVRIWHFGVPEKGGRGKPKFQPPEEAALTDARKRVGYQNLEYRQDPPALRKKIEGLEVDLSSIASGFTIDRIAALMAKEGAKDFMIDIGGEIRAAGKREDGKPWRVAVEQPQFAGEQLHLALPLKDASIATAGDYRKFFSFEGKRYSHVIDPATGRPIERELVSVTVVADECIDADGWDTPLLVLGPERGFECAEKNGIAALFISQTREGGDKKTSAWKKRFGD